jgi:hypothetical protein
MSRILAQVDEIDLRCPPFSITLAIKPAALNPVLVSQQKEKSTRTAKA